MEGSHPTHIGYKASVKFSHWLRHGAKFCIMPCSWCEISHWLLAGVKFCTKQYACAKFRIGSFANVKMLCLFSLLIFLDFSCPWASFFLAKACTKDFFLLGIVEVIQKLLKTLKLAKNWLESIARILNASIGLKGNNYYSKVLKTIMFKLTKEYFLGSNQMPLEKKEIKKPNYVVIHHW